MGLLLRIWDVIVWDVFDNAASHVCAMIFLLTLHAPGSEDGGLYMRKISVGRSFGCLLCGCRFLLDSIRDNAAPCHRKHPCPPNLGRNGQAEVDLVDILWLACLSTTASIIFSIESINRSANLMYGIPTMIFEAIIFISAAYHGIKASGGLRSLLLLKKDPFWCGRKPILHVVFQGSVLYFIAVFCSLSIIVLVDPRLGTSIMSVTVTHMLLHLRKQVLSDSTSPSSHGVELMTFRAITNGAMSLEVGEDVIDI
ncbi:hypothetical protein IW261DRAFT_1509594 [Armillaria novae-zelandiae]|uniref:Uncharacterized protein n=1 Tax=Armillaria novae-zelandiae TaxID=153914 RepID=A0AA39U119_9AGAR|nr:hypothetical protein IW261DRAFT_1509594 [Armillaria novae-zelandiae]